jgi:hypothetical protein
MLSRFLLGLIGKTVRGPVLRHLAQFEAATYRPREVQNDLLLRILHRQADTDFGKQHGFRQVSDAGQFRRQVPVAGYEYFEPYIARMRRGDLRALVSDSRVHMFALTSGTTAARKFIPVTDQYLADYRRGWNIWGMRVFRQHPAIKLRPIVQLSGDWNEFQTESGIPCGSVTGLTAEMQKRIIRWLYCVPGCTAGIKDVAAKYYMVLRLSLPRLVAMIVAANPSTLVNLARAGDWEKQSLIRDIHDGTLSAHVDIPVSIRQSLAHRWRRRDRERARQLEDIVKRTGNLLPRDYWAGDCLCGTWTGGSVGAYLPQLRTLYGKAMVRDVGLIASEGRMTIPFQNDTPSGVLDITSHYFEFIPQDEGDSASPSVVGTHEVEVGRNYYILLSTAFGLYRYHIHDLVRITGFYNQTPLVEFLSKGAHFANITGEKLSEYQVIEAMKEVVPRTGASLTDYTLAPCWDDQMAFYGLFVERGAFPSVDAARVLAEALDRQLCEINMEYASKRRSQRLGGIRLEILPEGTWEDWIGRRLSKSGGTTEQYKHPCLVPDTHFRTTLPIEQEISSSDSSSHEKYEIPKSALPG